MYAFPKSALMCILKTSVSVNRFQFNTLTSRNDNQYEATTVNRNDAEFLRTKLDRFLIKLWTIHVPGILKCFVASKSPKGDVISQRSAERNGPASLY
uniref:Uncharacterized protein n=1 Tax=Caenorhabditis japonica TaxID=281687 RepID=A0A8R1J1E6_CAEJA